MSVTHHGLQSTHEAIDNLVPMLSYPFFGDQPSQAAFCQVLGIAVPLGTRERAPRDDEIARALEHVSEQREAMSGELARVRSWEDCDHRRAAEVDERIRALALEPSMSDVFIWIRATLDWDDPRSRERITPGFLRRWSSGQTFTVP